MLAEIRMLRGKFEELTFRLGNLQVEKMELDHFVLNMADREKKLKEEWSSLKKLDEGLRDKIVDKFGVGNLNINDGTFTPAPLVPTPS